MRVGSWLVGVLRLLELDAFLLGASVLIVLSVVSLVGVELLSSALGMNRGLGGILGRRRIVSRGGRHPTCSSKRRKSSSATTAGVTSKEEKHGDNEEHDQACEHPSSPPIPRSALRITSVAAEIVTAIAGVYLSLDQFGQLPKRSHLQFF